MISTHPIALLILFLSILLSMAFHEATHAFIGHSLGDTTARDEGRLTLNPLKHIDLLTTVLLPLGMVLLGLSPFFVARPVPFNPYRVKYGEYGSALIGVSGPLSNLLLAFVGAAIIRLFGLESNSFSYLILNVFVLVNVGFFVFNMIPFPPLDGSRLIYAFAPQSLRGFMQRIEMGGLGSIFIFMFLLYPLIAPLIYTIDIAVVNFLL